jgi:hypothetical protein
MQPERRDTEGRPSGCMVSEGLPNQRRLLPSFTQLTLSAVSQSLPDEVWRGKRWFGSRHITSNATLVWVAFFIAFHINWCLYVWWSRSIQLIWNAMKNVGCYVTIAWTHVYHLMVNTLPYSAMSYVAMLRLPYFILPSKVGPSDDTRVTPHTMVDVCVRGCSNDAA